MKVAVLSQGAYEEDHVVAVYDAGIFTKEMGRLFLKAPDTSIEYFEVNGPFRFLPVIEWDFRATEVPG